MKDYAVWFLVCGLAVLALTGWLGSGDLDRCLEKMSLATCQNELR